MATPRMQLYIDYAAEIYGVYLDYIAPEDIHIYSVDEAFLDVTHYLWLYNMTAKELAIKLIDEVYKRVGVRATCGIGTNMYLCKIALDIIAKHSKDSIGVLDEKSYRETMWNHKPLTDFWRIGNGTAERLARYGIYTMGDIAHTPEDILYKWFGIDAELLIDHAYGREPTTLQDIKNYKAKSNCLSSSQVLMRDYTFLEARLIVKEMLDLLCLDMVSKKLITDSLSLYVGYSNKFDISGAKGTAQVAKKTNADSLIIPAVILAAVFGMKTAINSIFNLSIGNDVLFLCFFVTATPLGLNTVVFPEAYGGNPQTGASMAMISHTLCVISIPLMYALAVAIFGTPFTA